jgi:hypothetical protein
MAYGVLNGWSILARARQNAKHLTGLKLFFVVVAAPDCRPMEETMAKPYESGILRIHPGVSGLPRLEL